jgi:hypothetical protein
MKFTHSNLSGECNISWIDLNLSFMFIGLTVNDQIIHNGDGFSYDFILQHASVSIIDMCFFELGTIFHMSIWFNQSSNTQMIWSYH